ncbi:MAG TPA: hypothetical protein VLA72_02725 [Anaerolineales bacterium]|nr:hypothetical protein [Anaerolineales bacterium]
MSILTTVVIGFLILEAINVITLYFAPGSKLANGVGVFKAWEESKQYPDIHNFIKYLVNWVAGAKLIFIFLLIVVLYFRDQNTLLYTTVALFASVLSFYWRLFPLIRQMDQNAQIEPKNYSIGLAGMVLGFIIIFFVAVHIVVL